MVAQDDKDYPYPVSELLTHGPAKECRHPDEWFDYVGHYGLGENDVPTLIRLAGGDHIDRTQPAQCYAPIHACRALGQLGDDAADIYLVKLLDDADDDSLTDNVLEALSMMGARSLIALQRYFDGPETSMWSQISAARGFALFAQRNPQHRLQCVSFLSHALSNCAQLPSTVNGFLIDYLVQLQAKEASKDMEQAFLGRHVDEDVCGPWPAVQVQLGLADEADFTANELLCPSERF